MGGIEKRFFLSQFLHPTNQELQGDRFIFILLKDLKSLDGRN